MHLSEKVELDDGLDMANCRREVVRADVMETGLDHILRCRQVA